VWLCGSIPQPTCGPDAVARRCSPPRSPPSPQAHGGHGGAHGEKAKLKAIPIPDIREVETHYRDYLPLFAPPMTYLHGKGDSWLVLWRCLVLSALAHCWHTLHVTYLTAPPIPACLPACCAAGS
jgi:hypothetical protein